MTKADKQAIVFVIIFLISAGFILGYFTGLNNAAELLGSVG